MNRFDDEPLSPEERALADRLARLGPHDGPSPSLDAKLLAAAHAAVAPKQRRRRWLGLTAIPGSLVTGAGMAAALVLVVGTVWQLRPSDPAPRPAFEGEMAPVDAVIIARRQQVVAPPPPPAEAAAPERALSPPSVDRRAAMAQRKTAPAPVATAAPAPAPEPEPAPAPARVATVGPDEARHFDASAPAATASEAYSAAPAMAPAAPPAPASAAPEEVDARADAARSEAFGLARARQQESLDERAKVTAMKQAAAEAEARAQSTTLDRIEVTGNRVKDDSGLVSDVSGAALTDIPVADDTKLDAKAWLERVRARRDAGDVDGARDSLARFRKAHPRVSLPQDLRALGKPATTR